MTSLIAEPGGTVRGELRPPGDKSVTHRAFLLASLADGETVVANPLLGEDARATLRAVAACGAQVDETDAKRIVIRGNGEWREPDGEVDCGNAGTLMRLLCGAAAGQNIACKLTGDESLSRRPMARVAEPLSQMGANIKTTPDGTPPVVLSPHSGLRGIAHDSPTASAQVKSALLLAGLHARGTTTIREPRKSRDHTERMLPAFGARVEVDDEKNIARVVGSDKPLRSPEVPLEVPADISSAAFFMVAAAIVPGSDLLLRDIGVNPARTGVINILRRMGADIELQNPRTICGEPLSDIRVRSDRDGRGLCGVEIGASEVPSALDEFPALFIAAACARGKTELSGARELRVKESDRIAAMADGLSALGVASQTKEDGVIIPGADDNGAGKKAGKRARGSGIAPAIFTGGEVESHGDHRIAMSFAIASLRAAETIKIRNATNISTSFPRFPQTARRVGVRVTEE